MHECLEILNVFLMLARKSHLFASLIREISWSTLEIDFIFPRVHVLFSISFFRLIFIKRRNIYILQRQR